MPKTNSPTVNAQKHSMENHSPDDHSELSFIVFTMISIPSFLQYLKTHLRNFDTKPEFRNYVNFIFSLAQAGVVLLCLCGIACKAKSILAQNPSSSSTHRFFALALERTERKELLPEYII